MRRIGKITGRSDDMLIIRGVNVFPTQVEEQVLKIAQLAPHYQLVLSREGNLDALEILTEVRVEFDHLSETEREALGKQLQHAVKSYIGVTARVRVAEVGFVERTLTGKARRVIDKRPR
jgi:phenylacetate-CoA ligase